MVWWWFDVKKHAAMPVSILKVAIKMVPCGNGAAGLEIVVALIMLLELGVYLDTM